MKVLFKKSGKKQQQEGTVRFAREMFPQNTAFFCELKVATSLLHLRFDFNEVSNFELCDFIMRRSKLNQSNVR